MLEVALLIGVPRVLVPKPCLMNQKKQKGPSTCAVHVLAVSKCSTCGIGLAGRCAAGLHASTLDPPLSVPRNRWSINSLVMYLSARVVFCVVLCTLPLAQPSEDNGERKERRLSVLMLSLPFAGHFSPLVALGEELVLQIIERGGSY